MSTSLRLTAALFALAIALPAAAQSVTVTGNNGGTIQKNRECLRGAGSAMCQTSATATTANGQSATRNRTRVTGDGQSTTSVSRMGPNGQTGGRTRQVTR
ncbi:hypothetical protein [Pseudodonghicola flavimaris]|uniref:Uncharacterized protein n=1 Tax=Pseudodonghicola flavimaris TaxID=3050036 RepID=A0ABT7EV25_9RHOB|nr:hypothetical protein [Pseudodonghicola flavimaris]MDK3016158.1 hypothetical protein [Pseudodonghicola flavimaris]